MNDKESEKKSLRVLIEEMENKEKGNSFLLACPRTLCGGALACLSVHV